MIKIIDLNFLNEKAAIGCFLIKDNDDLVLIETGPSIYYDNIKKSLNKDINWKIDKPFNFNKAKLAKVRGKVSKNLPATANKIAKTINPKTKIILRPFDIFFEEMLLINLRRK